CFSKGKSIGLYKATEDVVITTALAGEIGPGLIWYEGLPFYWEALISGREIPINEDIYIAPLWMNTSKVNIVGHVDLKVTYPDGTEQTLSATQHQDREMIPGDGTNVVFEPFLSSQEGTYTLVATLTSAGQVLDSVTFALIAIAAVPEVEIVKAYIRKAYPSVSEAYSGWISFTPGGELNLALFGGRIQVGVMIRNPTNTPLRYTPTIYNYHWTGAGYVTDYYTLPGVEPVRHPPAPTGMPYSSYEYECDKLLLPSGELAPGQTGFVYTELFYQSRKWNNVYIQIMS
ncbi:unnamed protein product, partial [marine sediment metagenome]